MNEEFERLCHIFLFSLIIVKVSNFHLREREKEKIKGLFPFNTFVLKCSNRKDLSKIICPYFISITNY